VALPFTLKSYLKQAKEEEEEELWKLKYFTMLKYNLQKTHRKQNQNPSRYYNSITKSQVFQFQPKYHLSKILI
jgi:hypothetical protein